jgi:membrane-associated phospholipid phosphatase
MTEPDSAAAEGSLIRVELALLFGGLALALCSGLPVSGARVPGWEEAIFRAINDLPDFLYRPVWVVMQFGSFLAIFAVAIVALASRRFRLAIGLGIAGVSVYFLAEVLKQIVDRGRPAELLADVHIRGAASSGNGYPSGHAAVSFALATIAFLWFGPRVRWAFLAAAIVVCFGRVYVGAHFPLDVVGGAAIGVASAAFVGLILRVRHHGHHHRRMALHRRSPAS